MGIRKFTTLEQDIMIRKLGRWFTIDPKTEMMRRFHRIIMLLITRLGFLDPDGMQP